MISGDNFQFGKTINDDSYYFSNINHIWGWAGWRNKWQHDYDVALKQWPKMRDEGRVRDWYESKAAQDRFTFCLDSVYNGNLDTWDYQWDFGSRLNGRFAVLPNVNLISNIGFGIGATHTVKEGVFSEMKVNEIIFPLKHPHAIFCSKLLDGRYFNLILSKTMGGRVKSIIKKLIKP